MSDPTAGAFLAAALDLARLGFPVFPLHEPLPGGGCSCRNPDCGKNTGRHPRLKGWQHAATTDEATIRRWALQWPTSNVGIPTGRGRVVLDVDPRNGGDESIAELQARFGPLPTTPTVLTGGGGAHYWFAVNGVVHSFDPAPGLNLKGDGGYVVAPGSRHASGRSYRWEASSHPADVAPAALPAWVTNATGADGGTEAANGVPANGPIPEGQRDVTLFNAAVRAARLGFAGETLIAFLEALNRRCDPPLPADHIRKLARQGERYGSDNPALPRLDDAYDDEGRLIPPTAEGAVIASLLAWIVQLQRHVRERDDRWNGAMALLGCPTMPAAQRIATLGLLGEATRRDPAGDGKARDLPHETVAQRFSISAATVAKAAKGVAGGRGDPAPIPLTEPLSVDGDKNEGLKTPATVPDIATVPPPTPRAFLRLDNRRKPQRHRDGTPVLTPQGAPMVHLVTTFARVEPGTLGELLAATARTVPIAPPKPAKGRWCTACGGARVRRSDWLSERRVLGCEECGERIDSVNMPPRLKGAVILPASREAPARDALKGSRADLVKSLAAIPVDVDPATNEGLKTQATEPFLSEGGAAGGPSRTAALRRSLFGESDPPQHPRDARKDGSRRNVGVWPAANCNAGGVDEQCLPILIPDRAAPARPKLCADPGCDQPPAPGAFYCPGHMHRAGPPALPDGSGPAAYAAD